MRGRAGAAEPEHRAFRDVDERVVIERRVRRDDDDDAAVGGAALRRWDIGVRIDRQQFFVEQSPDMDAADDQLIARTRVHVDEYADGIAAERRR